jgi:hypothetical protein
VRTCGGGVALALTASLALLAASAPADAAPRRITGTLTKPGYTVIAVGAGKVRSVRTRAGRFSIVPPASIVTLHLRSPKGKYAGPIVVRSARSGSRAILGVRPGVRLGRVRVRAGYARVGRRLSGAAVDPRRWARARGGVPIGVGRFGRVRSRPPWPTMPDDRDLDGVADPLDVDDDGDLILDIMDPRPRSPRAKRVLLQAPGELVNSMLNLGLHNTVNANAAALTDAQMDAALAGEGILKLNTRHEDWPGGATVELDCAAPQTRTDPSLRGLVYCTRGGTGRIAKVGVPPSEFPPFPDCCDPDGDGFGTLQSDPSAPGAMFLSHGATSAQIGTGDILIFRVTKKGVERQFVDVVQAAFATVPALVRYDDGRGNARSLAYPIPVGDPLVAEGLPVAAGPDGKVRVTLTFWRPQRTPIPGESGEWIDIGHLTYSVWPGGTNLVACPAVTMSESDPDLITSPPDPDGDRDPSWGFFWDQAADRPASPANTFTYTVNLTDCLAAGGLSFNPGQSRWFTFGGGVAGGGASQTIAFKRQ